MELKLIDRIKKLLALGKRGGNEAEMDAAMRKVHELVAMHNLSLSDIEASATTEDALALKLYGHVGPRQSWKIIIIDGLAKLYFSQAFRHQDGKILLLAKPSNAMVIHHLFLYCVKTCERNSRKLPAGTSRASFKAGFSHRLSNRCIEEANRAISNKMVNPETGKELILAPLYHKAQHDMNNFFQDNNQFARRGEHRVSQEVGDADAYRHGVRTANSVSIRPNGIETQTESVKLLSK